MLQNVTVSTVAFERKFEILCNQTNSSAWAVVSHRHTKTSAKQILVIRQSERPLVDLNVRMSDQLVSDQSSRRYVTEMLTLRKSAECTLPGQNC